MPQPCLDFWLRPNGCRSPNPPAPLCCLPPERQAPVTAVRKGSGRRVPGGLAKFGQPCCIPDCERVVTLRISRPTTKCSTSPIAPLEDRSSLTRGARPTRRRQAVRLRSRSNTHQFRAHFCKEGLVSPNLTMLGAGLSFTQEFREGDAMATNST